MFSPGLMKSAFLLSILALAAVGCAAPARLSGRFVYLTNASDDHPVAVGQSDQPQAGGPLHLVPGSPAAGACLPAEEDEQMFGETCEHESEGDAPGADAYVRCATSGELVLHDDGGGHIIGNFDGGGRIEAAFRFQFPVDAGVRADSWP